MYCVCGESRISVAIRSFTQVVHGRRQLVPQGV